MGKASGIVIWVYGATNPSAPIKSLVVSHPIALFLARERVFNTLPEGKTTVALIIYSPFMLPKRTAAVPEPPQPLTVGGCLGLLELTLGT